MMKKIIFILYCSTLVLFTANAEDIKNKFNPIQTAVNSQNIAADAKAGGMGDMGAATEPTHRHGMQLNILSVSARQVLCSIIPLGCVR